MTRKRKPFLYFRNISKSFGGVQALNNVSFDVKKGEVHGLMGENGAGKSTLMNILMGLIEPDDGEIIFQGERLENADVRGSLDRGIAMVHQEILPEPELSVAQNISLGQEKTTRFPGWIDEKKLIERARNYLWKLEVTMDVTRKMKYLSIAEMQMVEIAKALSNDAGVIILDEPTSSLSDKETENLFRIVKAQNGKGVTIIYISHKMKEIFRICDSITVLRDGEYIATRPASNFSEYSLINMMVGRDLKTVYPKKNRDIGEVIFAVKRLNKEGRFSNISFEVKRGEIVGFAGLIGAGRTDIMQSLVGLSPIDSGTICLSGREVKIKNPGEAIDLGLSLVTEDRKESGLIPDLSVRNNLVLSSLGQLRSGLFVNGNREKKFARMMMDDLRIKTPTMEQPVKFLSGGNQQKVVIGKSLLASPDVLILDEPTRGIDVGAKFEIYQLIDRLARQGKAIILVSSELPELLGLSHRILVLSNGEISAELSAEETTQETIMKYAIQN